MTETITKTIALEDLCLPEPTKTQLEATQRGLQTGEIKETDLMAQLDLLFRALPALGDVVEREKITHFQFGGKKVEIYQREINQERILEITSSGQG